MNTKKKTVAKTVAKPKNETKKYIIDGTEVSETLYKSVQFIIGNAIEAEEEKSKESFVAGIMVGVVISFAVVFLFCWFGGK